MMKWRVSVTVVGGPVWERFRRNPFSFTMYQETRPTHQEVIEKARKLWKGRDLVSTIEVVQIIQL